MNERLASNFRGSFPEKYEDPRPSIRIRVDGKFVKMNSGKSRWDSIGSAKSALKLHFEQVNPSLLKEVQGEGFWTIRNKRWADFIDGLIADKTLEIIHA